MATKAAAVAVVSDGFDLTRLNEHFTLSRILPVFIRLSVLERVGFSNHKDISSN